MIPPEAPGFWMHETSGVLRPVVERYLNGKVLGPREIATMRAYLVQWVNSPVWDQNPHADEDSRAELQELRGQAAAIKCQRDITVWLRASLDLGMDPL